MLIPRLDSMLRYKVRNLLHKDTKKASFYISVSNLSELLKWKCTTFNNNHECMFQFDRGSTSSCQSTADSGWPYKPGDAILLKPFIFNGLFYIVFHIVSHIVYYSWTLLRQTSLRRILHYDEVKVRSLIESFLYWLKFKGLIKSNRCFAPINTDCDGCALRWLRNNRMKLHQSPAQRVLFVAANWRKETALSNIEPTDTNNHAIIWVIDLI